MVHTQTSLPQYTYELLERGPAMGTGFDTCILLIFFPPSFIHQYAVTHPHILPLHLLSLPYPSQESGTSCSVESERVWLRSRHDNLSAVVSHLTPGPEKLLKAMETRNLAEFM